jgi:hypothetical protein
LKHQLALSITTGELALDQAKHEHQQEVAILQEKISQMFEKHATEKT